ncbi:MAG: sigma-54-dependent transcriptional regulator, partial [Paracoccaceae bacterium]
MGDILIVDDERDIRELIADILEDEGFSARKVGTADDCMREVMTAPPNLLILDIWLKDSDMDGIDILKRVKKEYPNIPVVIISGHGNIEIAVAAIKQGAYDFIEKPFNIDQLLVVIKRAMETSRLRHENTSLRQKDRPSAQMLGESPAFKTLVLQLEKLTKTNSRVLLTGPSGCGKELAARYIHNNSERAQAPFVVVNCASIEADKMDSVLFGHEDKNKSYSTGLLEQANGGTVYLDEVADMPLATQSKLLRVLVDQGFSRLGGVDTVKVDFRVISSTSQNLSHAIEKREFR